MQERCCLRYSRIGEFGESMKCDEACLAVVHLVLGAGPW
jgi:hypothetical protein